MNLQTCKTFCTSCLPQAQQQQEQYTHQAITRHASPPSHLHHNNKEVFSFKLHSHRQYHLSDKYNPQTAQTRISRMRSVEAGAPVFQPNVDSRSPPHARFYSPPLKEETSLQVTAQAEVRAEHSNLQSLLSPRVSLQPKVVFHFSTSNPTPTVPPLKMTGKRLRTNEEETEYSSKHSQVIFKSSFEVPDNSSWATFQKSKEGHNQVSFKQASQPSLHGQEDSLQTISEQMPSSQEQSYQPTRLDYYRNGNTMQTIVTSTEIKSRNSSKFSNQLRLLREEKDGMENRRGRDINQGREVRQGREGKMPQQLSFDAHPDQNYSNQATPKAYLSPRENYGLPNDPNLFEGSARQNVSPRVSVLSLSKHNQNQEEEQEELRDVIDHNFLVSAHCSRNNSAKVSLMPSLKNVSDNEHSQRQWHLSPLHSREGSWQLGPLMSTRAKFQRTNTIQSIESYSSEMISCLDIKFMQKNKGRRGVSRLL